MTASVDCRRTIAAERMTAIGTSRPLSCIPARVSLLLCPKSMDEAGTIGGPLTEGGQFVVFDCSCAAQGRRWSAETTVDQALIRGFRLPCLRLGAGPCLNGGRRAAARPRSKGQGFPTV